MESEDKHALRMLIQEPSFWIVVVVYLLTVAGGLCWLVGE
jgi:hypothetical protein